MGELRAGGAGDAGAGGAGARGAAASLGKGAGRKPARRKEGSAAPEPAALTARFF